MFNWKDTQDPSCLHKVCQLVNWCITIWPTISLESHFIRCCCNCSICGGLPRNQLTYRIRPMTTIHLPVGMTVLMTLGQTISNNTPNPCFVAVFPPKHPSKQCYYIYSWEYTCWIILDTSSPIYNTIFIPRIHQSMSNLFGAQVQVLLSGGIVPDGRCWPLPPFRDMKCNCHQLRGNQTFRDPKPRSNSS